MFGGLGSHFAIPSYRRRELIIYATIYWHVKTQLQFFLMRGVRSCFLLTKEEKGARVISTKWASLDPMTFQRMSGNSYTALLVAVIKPFCAKTDAENESMEEGCKMNDRAS